MLQSEERRRGNQWMAVSQNTYVYMKAVKTCKNEETKSAENGNFRLLLCRNGTNNRKSSRKLPIT